MRAVAVMLVLALPVLAVALADSPLGLPEADRAVDAITSRLASVEHGGSEYRKARFTTLANLGSGGQQAISMFTIEGVGGDNNYTFYITLLMPDRTHSRFVEVNTLQVGGKGIRSLSFDKLNVRDGQVVVPTMTYAEQDATCCPSIPGKARFEVKGGKLIEVTGAP
jgi:hypothetical protein